MKHPFNPIITVVIVIGSHLVNGILATNDNEGGGLRRIRKNGNVLHHHHRHMTTSSTGNNNDNVRSIIPNVEYDEDIQFWTRLLQQASLPIIPPTPTTPAPSSSSSSSTSSTSLPPVTDSTTTSPTTIANKCGLTPSERRTKIERLLQDANINPYRKFATNEAFDWLINTDGATLCPTDTNIIQRYVLAVLYYSTNGNAWTNCSAPSNLNDESSITQANDECNITTTNATVLFPNDIRGTDAWLTPSNECLWGGVSCYGPGTEFLPWTRQNNDNNDDDDDDDDDKATKEYTISAIEFENNNLDGTLPDEIGFGLSNIRFLALERERLVGTIPSSYGNLVNLLLLDFDFNTLSGVLPNTLWKLKSLRQLDLNNNDFSGTLSEDIGLLKDLRFFQIDNNKMSGTIPRSMGDIKNFSLIGLSENYFTGSMPTEICALRPSPLETLVVDCNIVCKIPECCTSCIPVDEEGGTEAPTTTTTTIMPTTGGTYTTNIPTTTMPTMLSEPPVSIMSEPPVSTMSEPPVSTPVFKCPLSTFVGCTAPDPSNPVDECPVAGEFSEACNTGEFCCVDDCPRNYCTAKEAV